MKQKYDIFISYRREDGAEFAEGLGMVLASKGYRVFFDKNDLQVGTDFPYELSAAVRNCHEFISIVTPSYCGPGKTGVCRIFDDGDWVHEELRIALSGKEKLFFPISIDCTPPREDSLPPDIVAFAGKSFVIYNRAYDTYDKIVERISPFFSEATSENATIGVISGLLATVDVNDELQFNVVCKNISRFVDDTPGEKALLHILNARRNNCFIYERDYRYVVFYTLFSSLRRNHQAIKLIELVKQHGGEFSEYAFTQYVYVEYYHTLFQLETDDKKGKVNLLDALAYSKKAVNMLPKNNGVLHCYALSIALAAENGIQINHVDYSRAVETIKQIIANDPTYALYYCTYARLLAYAGKYQEALVNLKRAQALEKPTHNDWILRISDYRKYELIVRLMEAQKHSETHTPSLTE